MREIQRFKLVAAAVRSRGGNMHQAAGDGLAGAMPAEAAISSPFNAQVLERRRKC